MGGLFCSYYIENSLTSLRKAISASNVAEIKRLIESSKNTSLFSSPVKYISHLCSYYNNSDDEDLINCQIDNKGNTPLTLSIETGQLESFKFLLIQLNANPNKCNYLTGFSPLHMIASTKCDANLNYKNYKIGSQKSTSSSRAILISQQQPQSPSKSSMGQSSSLEMGSVSDEILKEMVYLLVDKGADMNKTIQVDIFKELINPFMPTVNPLMLAIYNLNFIVVEELLNLGCDCNSIEVNSKLTAIHLACYLSSYELVSLLLDDEMRFVKVRLDIRSTSGNSCLHWLALSKETDDIGIFKLLINYLTRKFTLENAPSPTSSNSMSEWTQVEVDKMRNVKGLDDCLKKFLDQANEDGQTALMFASLNNKQHLVRQMLDYDATIGLKDKDSRTAHAYAKKNQSCSQLLTSFTKIKSVSIQKNLFKINSSHDQLNESGSQNGGGETGDDGKKRNNLSVRSQQTIQEEDAQSVKNVNILNIKQVKSDLAKVI